MRQARDYGILVCIFVGWMCGELPARADYITAQLNGNSIYQIIHPGDDVTINSGNGNTPSIPYYPGEMNWTAKGTNNPAWLTNPFTTFCIELTQDVSPGNTYTYKLVQLQDAPNPGTSQNGNGSGMGIDKADKIRQLWYADYNSIGSDGVKAAAFQLAIWKIEYDWTSSSIPASLFTSGNFRASESDLSTGHSDAITQATSWLTSIWSDTNAPMQSGLLAMSNPHAQDQIIQDAVLPVPPSLHLAGIGCILACAYGLRRRWLGMATTLPMLP